jgi:nucleoside-diphosphate-sugar epimerase
MNILILGLGYTAGFFARAALAQGWEITGTVRDADRAAELSRGGIQTLVFGGFAVSRRLAEAVEQADAVLVSIQPSEDGDPVLNALSPALAAASRLRWVGYLSTIGVYGDHAGAWIDETTPPKPGNARNRRRVEVEQQWLAFGAATAKAVQIFRLAGIYGPGRSPLAKLRSGQAHRIVKPGQVFNRIHVDDIAAVLTASLDHPKAGAIYNVSDDEPAPPQDVVTLAAELTGLQPPPEVAFSEADLSPMAASFYGENKRVSNALVKREFGYTLRHPTYREGLRALFTAGE